MARSPIDRTNRQPMFLQDFMEGKEFSSLDIPHRLDCRVAGQVTYPRPPMVAHAISPLSSTTNTINVNGTRFDVGQDTFCRLAPRLLAMGAKLVPTDSAGEGLVPSSPQEKIDKVTKTNPTKAQRKEMSLGVVDSASRQEFYVERHAPSFVHILDFFQHGELHLPPDVCPHVFRRELSHWGVEPTLMADCCQRKYLSFLDDQETLRHFNSSFIGSINHDGTSNSGKPPSTWSQLRMRVWSILDDPTSSTWAKVYITMAVLFVILSVFVLVASTDNTFKRSLTTDEWLDYFDDDEQLVYAGLLGLGGNKDGSKDGADGKHDDHHHDGHHDDHDDDTSPSESTEPPTDPSDSPLESDTTEASATNNTGAQPQGPKKVGKRSVGDHPPKSEQTVKEQRYNPPSPQQTNIKYSNSKEMFADTQQSENNGPSYSVVFGDGKKVSHSNHITNTNMRNFMDSLVEGLSAINAETRTQRNGDKHEADISGSPHFEIRVLESYDSYHQTDTKHVDVENKNDHGTRRDTPHKDKTKDAETNGEGNNVHTRFGSLDQIQTNTFRPQADQLKDLVIRHRRSAQSNSGSNNTDGGNHTNGVDHNSCYKISGSELATLINNAYETGASTIISTTTTVTELPQDVFTVKNWISRIEMACIVFFTIEFLLRLIFCPSKRRFIINFFTFVDVVSLASMYAVLLLHHFNTRTKYTATYVDVINCLQVARVFRFFRLVKDVVGFRVLVFSVRTSWRELLLLLLYIVMLVSIFASLAYYSERENFRSIIRAAWWAIVTMTTVGYGDIAPVTVLGRFVGAACALSGVLLIAVTVPVFVNNFLLFYEHSKILDQQVNAQKSGGAASKEEEDQQVGRQVWSRTNSASTNSTSTSFSRQQSTLSSTPTPVEAADPTKPAFSYSDDADGNCYGLDKQRRPKAVPSKGSQVSLTKVQPVM
ncbi:potassium voltage-gated channel protein Shaw [Elysia marginata]|uniref:Potassium voltage-gated channel protein Shaw n=1 Tax=Elysia marginata TaxID=1093978 RepID=A0AAV4G471_9GAST|nr:potassium voltage-gated channel protein Shaw [Elysia marginata]